MALRTWRLPRAGVAVPWFRFTTRRAASTVPTALLEHRNPLEMRDYDLVVLNSELPAWKTLVALWRGATLRVCADGGANRWYDSLQAAKSKDIDIRGLAPSAICGDFDSLLPTVRNYFEKQGTVLHHVLDQDHNDLQKSIDWVQARSPIATSAAVNTANATASTTRTAARRPIVVAGALGGRTDHMFAALHFLINYTSNEQPMVLMGRSSVVHRLSPGQNRVYWSQAHERRECGIVGFGNSALTRVTTKGLRWNLENSAVGFDGMLSSSNKILDTEISVNVTGPTPILYCIEMNESS